MKGEGGLLDCQALLSFSSRGSMEDELEGEDLTDLLTAEQAVDLLNILEVFLDECGDKVPPPSFMLQTWFSLIGDGDYHEFASRMKDFTYNYLVTFRDSIKDAIDNKRFLPADVGEEHFEKYVSTDAFSVYEYVYNQLIFPLVVSFVAAYYATPEGAAQSITADILFDSLQNFLDEVG